MYGRGGRSKTSQTLSRLVCSPEPRWYQTAAWHLITCRLLCAQLWKLLLKFNLTPSINFSLPPGCYIGLAVLFLPFPVCFTSSSSIIPSVWTQPYPQYSTFNLWPFSFYFMSPPPVMTTGWPTWPQHPLTWSPTWEGSTDTHITWLD